MQIDKQYLEAQLAHARAEREKAVKQVYVWEGIIGAHLAALKRLESPEPPAPEPKQ